MSAEAPASKADGGIWGHIADVGHDATHAIGDILSPAVNVVEHVPGAKSVVNATQDALWNVPVALIQHEYRYLHDVEARHGRLSAILEGAVLMAGMAAGTVLTGGLGGLAVEALGLGAEAAGGEAVGAGLAEAAGEAVGADGGAAADAAGSSLAKTLATKTVKAGQWVASNPFRGAALGGEAATGAMTQVYHRDSWARTASARYVDPNTHQEVSFGRDIASGLFHLDPKSGTYSDVSGLSDAIFDVFGDPVGNAGKMVGDARSAEGMGGLAGLHFSGTAMKVDNLEHNATLALRPGGAAFGFGGLRRWLETTATSTPAEIIERDRRFTPIAAELGAANTPDEVVDVLRDTISSQTAIGRQLPAISSLRTPFSKIREYAGNAERNTLHPIAGLLKPKETLGTAAGLLTRIPGTSFNEITRDFTRDKINLVNMRGADSLLAFFKLGMGDRAAKKYVDMMYAADYAGRNNILANGALDTLTGHAGLELGPRFASTSPQIEEGLNMITDPDLRQAIRDKIDGLFSPFQAEETGYFGGKLDGTAFKPLVDSSGSRLAGAILQKDVPEVTLPNYREVHRVAEMLSAATAFTGKVDDFLADKYTDTFFKPWVLLTEGYASRISVAELIPNVLREGFVNMALAAIRGNAAALGLKIDSEEELNAIQKVAWFLLKRVPNDQDMQDATASIMANSGYKQTRGLAAGHNLVDDGKDTVAAKQHMIRQWIEGLKKPASDENKKAGYLRDGDQYTLFGPKDYRASEKHQIWLRAVTNDEPSREAATALVKVIKQGRTEDEQVAAATQAAFNALQTIPEERRNAMIASKLREEGEPDTIHPLESWANRIVENMRAATHAPDHTPNLDLLNGVIHQRTVPLSRLERIPLEDRPLGVPGHELIPVGPVGGALGRITTIGFKRVINPTVNFLSRQPLYFTEYKKNMDILRDAVTRGDLSYEDAVAKASANATIDSIKYIHNLQDRTQLDALVRNWAPFFFAQEQAYRRVARLAVEDPGAFRRYQIMISGVHNIVSNVQDSDGNPYVAMPGAGYLGKGVVDILARIGIPTASVNPAGFGGTLSSANVVFPLSTGVRPELSPVVVIGEHMLANWFSDFGKEYKDFQPVTNPVVGAMQYAVGPQAAGSPLSTDVWQAIVPNGPLYDLIVPQAGNAGNTSFLSAMVQTLNSLDYQQQLAVGKWTKDGSKGPYPSIIPPPNASPPEMQAFIDKVTNQTRIMFAMRSVLAAVSPIGADVTVNDFGLRADLQAAITKEKGNLAAGYTLYLERYPDATAYETASTEGKIGPGSPTFQATQQAWDWYQANKGLVNQYPAAMWLMPQADNNDPFSQSVFNNQVAAGLRTRETPMEHLNALYTAAGDARYFPALTAHSKAVKAANGNRTILNAEYAKWDAWMQQFKAAYPVWWQNYNNGASTTGTAAAIDQLKLIYGAKQEPPGTQSMLVGKLLQSWNTVETQYTAASNASDYATEQKRITDAWQSYLGSIATSYPSLKPIIQSVFNNAVRNYNTN